MPYIQDKDFLPEYAWKDWGEPYNNSVWTAIIWLAFELGTLQVQVRHVTAIPTFPIFKGNKLPSEFFARQWRFQSGK
jgi:hypothetical protein